MKKIFVFFTFLFLFLQFNSSWGMLDQMIARVEKKQVEEPEGESYGEQLEILKEMKCLGVEEDLVDPVYCEAFEACKDARNIEKILEKYRRKKQALQEAEREEKARTREREEHERRHHCSLVFGTIGFWGGCVFAGILNCAGFCIGTYYISQGESNSEAAITGLGVAGGALTCVSSVASMGLGFGLGALIDCLRGCKKKRDQESARRDALERELA